MSERKLEPTPGWCERAQKMLVLYTNRAHFASQLIAEYEAAQKSGLLKHAGTWKGDDFEDCLAAVKPNPAPLPHEWRKVAEGTIWPLWECAHCWKTERCDDPPKTACPRRNAPLPHEWENGYGAKCKHCGAYGLVTDKGLCPARNEPPAAIIGAYDKRAEEQELERQSKKIFDALTKPAEKAEALPELSEKVSRPLTAAEKTRGIEIEMSLESRMRQIVHEEIRKARIEMDDFPHIVNSGQWSHRKHLRIVPGKEGE